MAKMIALASDRMEDIAGIGENTGYQNFFLSPYVFKKPPLKGVKVGMFSKGSQS